MLVKKIKKAELYSRRAALAANTSLEILKQRRFNATTRVRGRVYAKQFLSDSVRGVLLDADSFVVVIKCVDTGTDWSTFLNTFSAKNLKVRSILPVNNIRTLYSSLSAGLDLQWLIPHLASSSVYLLVTPNASTYLELVKHSLDYEARGGAKFFELLFLKEKNSFIDFTRHDANSFASDLRSLYLTGTQENILLELNSCIFSISLALSGLFSISLLQPPSAIYPIKYSEGN